MDISSSIFNWPKDQQIPKEIFLHIICWQKSMAYTTLQQQVFCYLVKTTVFFFRSMVIVSHFSGISGREALASIDCVGNLLQQYRDAYHFLKPSSTSFTIKGPSVKKLLEIPEEAIEKFFLMPWFIEIISCMGLVKYLFMTIAWNFLVREIFHGPVTLKICELGLRIFGIPLFVRYFVKQN